MDRACAVATATFVVLEDGMAANHSEPGHREGKNFGDYRNACHIPASDGVFERQGQSRFDIGGGMDRTRSQDFSNV